MAQRQTLPSLQRRIDPARGVIVGQSQLVVVPGGVGDGAEIVGPGVFMLLDRNPGPGEVLTPAKIALFAAVYDQKVAKPEQLAVK